MVIKTVRLFSVCFCYLFWTWPCTTFKSIPIILNLLSDRNIEKTKDCTRSGSFQHEIQHRCFQLWCLPALITSLLYFAKIQPIIFNSNLARFLMTPSKNPAGELSILLSLCFYYLLEQLKTNSQTWHSHFKRFLRFLI